MSMLPRQAPFPCPEFTLSSRSPAACTAQGSAQWRGREAGPPLRGGQGHRGNPREGTPHHSRQLVNPCHPGRAGGRLATHPRVHFRFTPKGASWLNMIETWFSILTRKSVRRAGVPPSLRLSVSSARTPEFPPNPTHVPSPSGRGARHPREASPCRARRSPRTQACHLRCVPSRSRGAAEVRVVRPVRRDGHAADPGHRGDASRTCPLQVRLRVPCHSPTKLARSAGCSILAGGKGFADVPVPAHRSPASPR